MVGLLGAISEQEQQGLLDPMPRRQPVGLLDLLRAIPQAFGNAGRAGLEGYAQALTGIDNDGRTIGNILPLARDERTGEVSLASPRILDLWNTVGGVGGGATLGAGPVMRRGGDALDMSTSARMARARDMGFDVDRPVYHGTDTEFTAFNNDAFGTGKTGAITRRQQPRGHYFTPQQDYAQIFGPTQEYMLRINNPKIYDYSDFTSGYAWDTPHGKEVARIADETGMSWREALDELNKRLQADGHDAIVLRQVNEGIPNPGDRVDEIIVFDPRNIRSTQAAFDPARADSADLLASRAAPGAVVPADRRRLNWRDAEDML